MKGLEAYDTQPGIKWDAVFLKSAWKSHSFQHVNVLNIIVFTDSLANAALLINPCGFPLNQSFISTLLSISIFLICVFLFSLPFLSCASPHLSSMSFFFLGPFHSFLIQHPLFYGLYSTLMIKETILSFYSLLVFPRGNGKGSFYTL